MSVGKATVDLVFDRSQISSNLNSSIEGATVQSAGAVSSSFKKLAGVAAAAFASVQIFQFVKEAFAEAEEAQKIAAQTEAVIASTGAAAGLTAQQFEDLAESVSQTTFIDDEEIQKAENMLATFTNIADAAGEGNDIFSQATSVIADMSAALGQDMTSSAMQLGKALNDPIAGLTALQRVGVKFTDGQKDMIEALVASGDTMGAQKIILAELNKEFGGSAAAQATSADKIALIWGNLKESFGEFLLPIVDWLAKHLPGALDKAGKAFKDIIEFIRPFAEQVGAFFKTLFTGFTEDEGTGIEKFALLLRNDVIPAIVAAFQWMAENIPPFIAQVVETVRVMVEWFTTNVVPIIREVVGFIVEQWQNLAQWTEEHWDEISEAIGHVVNVIVDIVSGVIAFITEAWELFGDDILKIVGAVWSQIQNIIETTINIIKEIIEFVMAVINGEWGEAWQSIKDVFSLAVGFILDTAKNVLSAFTGIIGGIFDGARDLAMAAIDKIVEFVAGLPQRILDQVTALFNAAKDLGAAIIGGIGDGLGAVVNFVEDIGAAVFEAFRSAWNSVVDLIAGGLQVAIDVLDSGLGPFINFSDTLAADMLDFLYLHEGGWVPGLPTENVPTMLQGGEFVLSRSMIDQLADGGGSPQPMWSGDVIVNNPVPEPASESVPREMRNLAYLLGG